MRPERALDGGYARMLHFKGGSHACLIPTRVAMHGASPRASTQNRALFCFRLPANRYPCTLRCATDAASPWTPIYRGPPRQRPERAEIGRASGRERVCQDVEIWVDGGYLTK